MLTSFQGKFQIGFLNTKTHINAAENLRILLQISLGYIGMRRSIYDKYKYTMHFVHTRKHIISFVHFIDE